MLPPLATLTLPCTSRSRLLLTSMVELVLPLKSIVDRVVGLQRVL